MLRTLVIWRPGHPLCKHGRRSSVGEADEQNCHGSGSAMGRASTGVSLADLGSPVRARLPMPAKSIVACRCHLEDSQQRAVVAVDGAGAMPAATSSFSQFSISSAGRRPIRYPPKRGST